MQTRLPFYPPDTKMINENVSYCEQNGMVYYLHYGNPVYCHSLEDRNGYRFALANLVVNRLCRICEISKAFGITRKNVERYVKAYNEKGAEYFFRRTERRGQCYRMTASKLLSIQSDLDRGLSVYRTALTHEISEAAISYHIKNGNLKKNWKPE